MKRLKKFLYGGNIAYVLLTLWVQTDFFTDRVSITISEEYSDKYNNEEFVVEDFQWDNAEKITYMLHRHRLIIMKLKKHGKNTYLKQ